ncbi:MAG: mechanosensitive ion channel domain-containing protein [Gammaproteobacteria bacterium]
MKLHLPPILYVVALIVFSALSYADPAIPLPTAIKISAPVSIKTLKSKIADTEASAELDEPTKNQLVEYYRKTIRNLEKIESNNAATEAFLQARKEEPQLAAQIKNELEERKNHIAPEPKYVVSTSAPLVEMERKLADEKAALAAAKAMLSDLEQQLELSEARSATIQNRLININREQQGVTGQLLHWKADDRSPLLAEARRWFLKTKLLTLRSEIAMFDQELLSLPARIEYLQSGQSWHQFSYQRLSERVAALQEIVNQQRQVDADKAKEQAEKNQHQLEGKPLLVQNLANENKSLTDELSGLANDLDQITRASEATRKENEQIENQFQTIQKRIEIGGYGRALGQVLIELDRQLPDLDVFQTRAAFRENRIAEIGLKQLKNNEDYRKLSSIPHYVDQLTASVPKQQAAKMKADLTKLVANRKELLVQLNKLYASYLQSLNDYEFIDQSFLSTVQDYKNFLAQNRVWSRSSPPPSLAGFKQLPEDLDWLFTSALWRQVPLAFFDQATRSPMPALGVAFFLFLLWKAKHFYALLRKTGANIGKISKDKISDTFNALLLTLLLAASWPLLITWLGWQLGVSAEATPFTHVIADLLVSVALSFFYIRIFWVLCEPGGLANVHFLMPEATTQRLHRELGRMMAVLLPTQFIYLLIYRYDLEVSTGEAGRLLIAVILIALTVFLYRIIPSRQILVATGQKSIQGSWLLLRAKWLRFMLIAIPVAMLVLDMIGYTFTVAILTRDLVYTLYLVAGLFVIERIAIRWLLLTQRRLAWKSALEKRTAAKAKREAESAGHAELESEYGEVEKPEINFATLSEESLFLLKMSLILVGVLGFIAIWQKILPALSFLDNVALWSHMALVSGVQQPVPVTLLDVAVAVLIAFITYMVAKHLPSLLEIIMLQQTSLSAGSRYTVTTVTNYIVVAIGTILFFNSLGVDWSSIQWLIAALGVGIGFGLQEIVANFISGLIILFERPIRVGDIITIGGHDGTVIRIRIRTTSIRNWDRKELLVPNKQFITEKLINWTLSEQTSRIVIPVGLAYGGNVELAMKLLMEIAEAHPHTMSDPGPSVVFDAFGDNALSLTLRCYVPELGYRVSTTTELHQEINRRFNDAGLVIAYPQRDVHLDTTTPLQVNLVQPQQLTAGAA